MTSGREIHIGNPNGRIAVWCDEDEAVELALVYGPRDGFYREVMDAVEQAYPKPDPADEVQP